MPRSTLCSSLFCSVQFPSLLCSLSQSFSFCLILQLHIRGYTNQIRSRWRELTGIMSKMQQDVHHCIQIYHFVPSLTRQLVPYVHLWSSNRRRHFQSFRSLSQLLQLVQWVKFKLWPFPQATATSTFQDFLPEVSDCAEKKKVKKSLAKSCSGQ